MTFVAVLLVIGIGWGSTQSLGKIAVSTGYGEFGLIFWSLVVCSLVLGTILVFRRRTVPLTRATLGFGALIALVGTIIPNTTFYIGVSHLPAGIMSILIATVPLMAFPIAMMLGMERFSSRQLVGLLFGLGGVALIALRQTVLPDAVAVGWIWVAMIGPLFYAIEGNVVAKWGTAGLDAVQAMFIASVIGVVLVTPLVLVSGQWINPMRPWGPPEYALVLMSVVHAFMYAGYVWLAKHAGAVFATQTSYIVTASGICWAMLLLGERFGPLILLAGVIMLIGVALVQPRAQSSVVVV
ncbi:MAG: EamA family transporter [Cereibacter sphaeroides]|uniref:EamA family transporter n=1 Tax=Cereibacter sphaeroides TaxID=1063 RepID=A0A2W5SD08_CERSP|nr:MAG: EamA family transporter [Cereibacter sphaeroides]